MVVFDGPILSIVLETYAVLFLKGPCHETRRGRGTENVARRSKIVATSSLRKQFNI